MGTDEIMVKVDDKITFDNPDEKKHFASKKDTHHGQRCFRYLHQNSNYRKNQEIRLRENDVKGTIISDEVNGVYKIRLNEKIDKITKNWTEFHDPTCKQRDTTPKY